MPPRAFFDAPRDTVTRGGMHVTVHLVPVFEGQLVMFDVSAKAARGRWLPWAVLEFGQNPYEAASLLADDWCDVPLEDLSLADVMSFEVEGGGWELAIVFRAELAAFPASDGERAPVLVAAGQVDAIGAFDPVDIERWVGPSPESRAPGRREPEAAGSLVF